MRISKFFIFKPFFLYDGANYRPPNLGFRTLVVIYFQIIIANFKKIIGCNWNWKVLKADKSSENIKSFFKPFFLYDWVNYRPPNLGFRTLVVIYLKSILAIFQKKSVASKWNWKDLKANKSSENNKKIFLNHFSYMMEQIIDPPTSVFLNSCCNLLSNYYCKLSKKSVACKWNWKDLKANKSSENNKKIFLNHFFYMMEQIIDPPTSVFLNSCCNLLSNFYCKLSKKSVACKWNWKDLKANKSSENNKKIFLNHFFYKMEQIIDPPNLNFWTLAVIYFQIIIAN